MLNEMALGYQELLIILVILLLLFGSTRLPQLAKGLGKSIREFKKGVGEGEDERELEARELEDARRRERLRAAETNRLADDDLASNNVRADKSR